MNRQAIHVRIDYPGKCWTAACYLDGHADPFISAAFDTHVLPLPFTLQATEREVLAYVRERHPAAEVIRV